MTESIDAKLEKLMHLIGENFDYEVIEAALRTELASSTQPTGKVTESIFSGQHHVIPMSEVSHINKGKDGAITVIMRGTTASSPHMWEYNNAVFLWKEEADLFLQSWCGYRSELEAHTLADISPAGMAQPSAAAQAESAPPNFQQVKTALDCVDDIEAVSGKSGPSIQLRCLIDEINRLWNVAYMQPVTSIGGEVTDDEVIAACYHIDGDYYEKSGTSKMRMRRALERFIQSRTSATSDAARHMANEYGAWIDFYHQGHGDYGDFLKSRTKLLKAKL